MLQTGSVRKKSLRIWFVNFIIYSIFIIFNSGINYAAQEIENSYDSLFLQKIKLIKEVDGDVVINVRSNLVTCVQPDSVVSVLVSQLGHDGTKKVIRKTYQNTKKQSVYYQDVSMTDVLLDHAETVFEISWPSYISGVSLTRTGGQSHAQLFVNSDIIDDEIIATVGIRANNSLDVSRDLYYLDYTKFL